LLKKNFQIGKAKQDQLENDYKTCLVRKDRARELIDGLASEKENWIQNALKAEKESLTVVGDCILSAGIISYLGAFPMVFRDETITHWKQQLQKYQITFNQNYRFQEVLCDPITIGQWTNKNKLPNDSFSIDNAIIMTNSSRFPLFIDPQNQANQWIRNFEGSGDKLKILTPPSSQKQIQAI
jgi:dynein heavy chain, axonemal